MKIKPTFKWFDLWVGFFYDKNKRRLYFFPLPMFGIYLDFPTKTIKEKNHWTIFPPKRLRGTRLDWSEIKLARKYRVSVIPKGQLIHLLSK